MMKLSEFNIKAEKAIGQPWAVYISSLNAEARDAMPASKLAFAAWHIFPALPEAELSIYLKDSLTSYSWQFESGILIAKQKSR